MRLRLGDARDANEEVLGAGMTISTVEVDEAGSKLSLVS